MDLAVILQNTLVRKAGDAGAAVVQVPMAVPEGLRHDMQFGRLRFSVGEHEYVVSVTLHLVDGET